MCGALGLGKFTYCLLRMIDFLARCPSINAKYPILARRSILLIGFVARRWRFLSKLETSESISILVEPLHNCRRMSASILQFWVWPCQIHARDCLPRSNVYTPAMSCPAIRTISFVRWTLDFNSDRLQTSPGCGAIASKRIMAA